MCFTGFLPIRYGRTTCRCSSATGLLPVILLLSTPVVCLLFFRLSCRFFLLLIYFVFPQIYNGTVLHLTFLFFFFFQGLSSFNTCTNTDKSFFFFNKIVSFLHKLKSKTFLSSAARGLFFHPVNLSVILFLCLSLKGTAAMD